MSKEWTREEDEKLVYDYEHVVMPYLENRLKHITGKVGLTMNDTTFQEDNQRMLELMREGISLKTNASAIMGIMRHMDPEKCIETIDKVVTEPEGDMTKFDYDRLFEIRQLLEAFVLFKNDIPKEE